MKRILHLISHLEEGGAQRLLASVLEFGRGYEWEVASLIASPSEKLLRHFRGANVPIHFLSNSGDFYAPEILTALRKLIVERSYDLVHCWLFQSIVQGVMLCRKLGIPCISAVHSMRDLIAINQQKAWERNLINNAIRFSDLQLFVSTSMALDFLDSGCADPGFIRIVRNGVDCDTFKPAAGGAGIVAVGRFAAEKEYGELQEIIKQLRSTLPELRCQIAGGAQQQEADGMHFVGYVEDMPSFLQSGMVYVSTSRTEGLSVALLEAQACGLPAVARRLGGNAEVIDHGINGFLCSTRGEFVEHLRTLWTDPQLRVEMGRNARRRIERDFPIQTLVEKFESIYRELL